MSSLVILYKYLRRHPNYCVDFVCDVFKLLWYRLARKKLVVITTGSGGVGDYLWIRNYYPLLKEQGYKIILIAMAHWEEIVVAFDKNNIDIVRYFESCLSPKKIESFYFKLFKADVYICFRKSCIADFVKSEQSYSDDTSIKDNSFYEEKNNNTYRLFQPLPNGFSHQLPIIEPSQEKKQLLQHPYVVLVEGGNTQGKLSDNQLISIVKHLTDNGYNILFNGNHSRICNLVDSSICTKIIDGNLFTFPQYTYIVNEASFIVTVNTSIYHFALQLNRPCVVISATEYHTIKLYQSDQRYVFDNTLQKYYDNKQLQKYKSGVINHIKDISGYAIIAAIDSLNTSLKQ